MRRPSLRVVLFALVDATAFARVGRDLWQMMAER